MTSDGGFGVVGCTKCKGLHVAGKIVGLDAALPPAPDIRGVYSARSREATNILGGCTSQARTFTREEVLTALRARRAMMDTTASSDAARYNELADLIRIFERME